MPRRKPPHYSHYGLLPDSTPAWRWDRANQIIRQNKNRSLERDGPEIYRMVGFLRKTLNDFTGHGVKQLLKEDPNLVLAVKLKTAGGRRELEVQCRVLAGESASVIAVEVGSTKSIIETYCTFFFDVPDRLDQVGYIRHRVTKVPINGQASVESLAKLSCYNNGPAVVPAWLDYLDHIGEAHDLSTELGRQRETIELYTQAMNLELSPTSAGSFVKRSAFINDVNKNVFRERNAAELIRLNVSRMLSDSVVWAASKPMAGDRTVDHKNSRVENRSETATTGKMETMLRAI